MFFFRSIYFHVHEDEGGAGVFDFETSTEQFDACSDGHHTGNAGCFHFEGVLNGRGQRLDIIVRGVFLLQTLKFVLFDFEM